MLFYIWSVTVLYIKTLSFFTLLQPDKIPKYPYLDMDDVLL